MANRPPTLITGGLGKRRSLESRAGKLMRMARMLRRKGYRAAAEKFAMQGAEERMNTPAVRSQDYRWMEEQKQKDILALQTARRSRAMDFLRSYRPTPELPPAEPDSGGYRVGPYVPPQREMPAYPEIRRMPYYGRLPYYGRQQQQY